MTPLILRTCTGLSRLCTQYRLCICGTIVGTLDESNATMHRHASALFAMLISSLCVDNSVLCKTALAANVTPASGLWGSKKLMTTASYSAAQLFWHSVVATVINSPCQDVNVSGVQVSVSIGMSHDNVTTHAYDTHNMFYGQRTFGKTMLLCIFINTVHRILPLLR